MSAKIGLVLHCSDNRGLNLFEDDEIVLKETVALGEGHVAVAVALGKQLFGIQCVPELVVVCCDGDESGDLLR